LFFARREAGSDAFGEAVRVNHADGAAAAFGVIGAAQMALGPDGRVHVVWVGSRVAARVDGESGHPALPFLYTRSDPGESAFEPERNLLTWTGNLDGGGSVAVDSVGTVFVAWHGSAQDNEDGEFGRAVFLAVSRDAGEHFEREVRANPDPTGACGCCAMRAYVDSRDALWLLYRSANPESRDMTLLRSLDRGRSFASSPVNHWAIQACPLSTSTVASAKEGVFAATEVGERVEVTRFDGARQGPTWRRFVSEEKAKYPAVAANKAGEVLVAWVEGAGWGLGGTVKWRLFDENGEPRGDEMSGGKLAPWSFPAVTVGAEDEFILAW